MTDPQTALTNGPRDGAARGAKVRDIAQALDLSTATAWRRLERAKAQGLVADKPPETSETRPAAKGAETSETGPPERQRQIT